MNQNNYDKINTLTIQDKILFFDIFIRNNELIFISPFYLNEENFSHDNIKIFYQDNELNKIKNIIHKTYEKYKVLINIYSIKSLEQICNIKVLYDSITYEFNLFNLNTENKYKLIQTTLFKNDYNLINLFYNYYKDSVQHFYLYSNSIINEECKNIVNDKNITLIEWNFKYWQTNLDGTIISGHHFAQTGQINHCLYKYGKVLSNYMLFNDLDEYLYIENYDKKLVNYIDTFNQNYYIFSNCWCITLDSKIPSTFPKKFYKNNKIHNFPDRCKCIVKTSILDIMGIHFPLDLIVEKPNKCDSNLIILHFTNWTQHGRNNSDSSNRYEFEIK
jgi:hypothetical protein